MMRFQTPFVGLASTCACLLATATAAGAATIVVPAGGIGPIDQRGGQRHRVGPCCGSQIGDERDHLVE